MPPKKAAPKKAPAIKAQPKPRDHSSAEDRLGSDDERGLTGEYLEVKKPSSSDEESNKSEPEPLPEGEPEEEALKPPKKKNVPQIVEDPDAANARSRSCR